MLLSEKVAKYSNCMEEIKRRVEVVESLLAKSITTPYLITNTEFACIQIRKILELTALAAVVANKTEVERVAENLERLWNAKDILKKVAIANPKYYPHPIILQGLNGDPNNTRTQPAKKGYLTQDDFINIYTRCGSLLHAQNPFAKEKEFSQTYNVIGKWLDKIKKLLNQHIVNLTDESIMIMVLMNFGYQEKVSIGAYKAQDSVKNEGDSH